MSTARRMPDARARRLSVRTTSVQDYFKKNPGRKAGVLCFQPEAETEDVDLQPLQLDAADENPPTSDAADVPVPEDNDVLMLKAKAKEDKVEGAEPEDL